MRCGLSLACNCRSVDVRPLCRCSAFAGVEDVEDYVRRPDGEEEEEGEGSHARHITRWYVLLCCLCSLRGNGIK